MVKTKELYARKAEEKRGNPSRHLVFNCSRSMMGLGGILMVFSVKYSTNDGLWFKIPSSLCCFHGELASDKM